MIILAILAILTSLTALYCACLVRRLAAAIDESSKQRVVLASRRRATARLRHECESGKQRPAPNPTRPMKYRI